VPGFLSQYLDMPYSPQNGDSRLPRVARPTHGASLRMVVAPGHETEGILHLPAGQSGNPLSIFYRAGHDAWLLGNPTPFQPDPAQHRLILTP
jgi:penicillin amidase